MDVEQGMRTRPWLFKAHEGSRIHITPIIVLSSDRPLNKSQCPDSPLALCAFAMVYTLRRRLPLRFLALVSLFIVGGFLLAPGPRFAFPSFSSRVKGVSSLLYGSSIELLPSGLVKWSEGSGKHPIEELMLRGKAKWEGQLKR